MQLVYLAWDGLNNLSGASLYHKSIYWASFETTDMVLLYSSQGKNRGIRK